MYSSPFEPQAYIWNKVQQIHSMMYLSLTGECFSCVLCNSGACNMIGPDGGDRASIPGAGASKGGRAILAWRSKGRERVAAASASSDRAAGTLADFTFQRCGPRFLPVQCEWIFFSTVPCDVVHNYDDDDVRAIHRRRVSKQCVVSFFFFFDSDFRLERWLFCISLCDKSINLSPSRVEISPTTG